MPGKTRIQGPIFLGPNKWPTYSDAAGNMTIQVSQTKTVFFLAENADWLVSILCSERIPDLDELESLAGCN